MAKVSGFRSIYCLLVGPLRIYGSADSIAIVSNTESLVESDKRENTARLNRGRAKDGYRNGLFSKEIVIPNKCFLEDLLPESTMLPTARKP